MYKIFILLLYSTCCCHASLRVVRPVSLGGDKNYHPPADEKSSSSSEKEKSGGKLQVLSQTPANNSVAFNSKDIVVTFNRKIVLEKEKVLVSGPGEGSFMFSVSGEKLIITPSNLKKDTTYHINCTNAVKDFDKGYCNNIIISFSTGKELNKGCIKGKVLDLMTNNPVKDCLVALYRSSEQQKNIINSEEPVYFIRTNDNGEYVFEHLANDSYFVCAGMIERGSLCCDIKNNKYGFYKDYIKVEDNETNVDVDILKNELGDFKLVKSIVEAERYVLVFSQTIKKINSVTTYIKSKNLTSALKSYFLSDDKCSIIFNHSSFPSLLPNIDKLPCRISISNDFDTILDCDFELSFSSNGEEEAKDHYKLRIEHKDKFLTTSSFLDFRIISNKPIDRIADDDISLYFKDHLGYKYVIDKKQYSLVVDEDKYSIHVKSQYSILDVVKMLGDVNNFIAKDINLELSIGKNAIVLHNREDTCSMTFNFTFVKNFGSVSGEVQVGNSHVKIQLLDSNYKIIDTIVDSCSFVFKNIPEGKYKIRVFVWPQEQHVWSCGDINNKKIHDPVMFYKNDIDVMNNSDIKNIYISSIY